MRRIGRRQVIWLCVILVPLLGLYLAFVHRMHARVENAGWVVEFSYVPLRCTFCFGRVERFTCNGQPIPQPELSTGEPTFFRRTTPVGNFETRSGWTEYRSHGVRKIEFASVGDPVAPDELTRRYYDCLESDQWPAPRRPGTPAHWCPVSSGYGMRWLDPEAIDDLSWAEPTSAPSTAPSDARSP